MSPPIFAASLSRHPLQMTTLAEAAEALRIMGQAGMSATEAARKMQRAMEELAKPMSEVYLGYVPKCRIWLDSGDTITLENVHLNVDVETETMNHYSMGSQVPDMSVAVNEKREVTIKVDREKANELFRLIRED